jgi:nucleoside-diphosphate-sugar epimerase
MQERQVVMERVLVIAAGGYIGTTLVPMLLAEGYEVRALDRFLFGRRLLPDHEQLELLQPDIRRVEPAYLEGVDHVIRSQSPTIRAACLSGKRPASRHSSRNVCA